MARIDFDLPEKMKQHLAELVTAGKVSDPKQAHSVLKKKFGRSLTLGEVYRIVNAGRPVEAKPKTSPPEPRPATRKRKVEKRKPRVVKPSARSAPAEPAAQPSRQEMKAYLIEHVAAGKVSAPKDAHALLKAKFGRSIPSARWMRSSRRTDRADRRSGCGRRPRRVRRSADGGRPSRPASRCPAGARETAPGPSTPWSSRLIASRSWPTRKSKRLRESGICSREGSIPPASSSSSRSDLGSTTRSACRAPRTRDTPWPRALDRTIRHDAYMLLDHRPAERSSSDWHDPSHSTSPELMRSSTRSLAPELLLIESRISISTSYYHRQKRLI